MSVYRYVDTEFLEVRNPLVLIHTESTPTYTDTHDIGIVGQYSSGTVLQYTGLFRDHADSVFKLFQGLQTMPNVDTGVINKADAGYALADLNVQNFKAFGNLDVGGDMHVYGNVTTLDVATLNVSDNMIVANSGPSKMRPDAGFISKRLPASIATDDVKESGTASATGTTTTIALQAAHGHGATLNFYTGWVVKTAGDVTGTTVVVSSTATDPPVLTLAVALSGATSLATTYQLFNQQYVGTIYSDAGKKLTAFGFPREDLVGSISLTGTAGDGNIATYIDTQARDIYVDRDMYIGRNIKNAIRLDDNIIAANMLLAGADSGYVAKRSTIAIVANDVPALAAVPIATSYVSGATTIAITYAATDINYFKGWTITRNADKTEPKFIVSSTVVAGIHTLVLSTGFTVALTSGTDVIQLFNKTYVGTVYNASSNTLMSVGFPREDGESIISPLTPVAGNVPSYLNTSMRDVLVTGTPTFNLAFFENTKTFTAAATFANLDLTSFDILFLNPAADSTFTMPTVTSINMAIGKAKPIVLINISAFRVTIVSNVIDTFEGRTSLLLSRVYSKTVLVASAAVANTWFIKG